MPETDELVVCKITKLHPNSAFATLVEYNKTGMIHVSEVAKRWVRDIREFVKENQLVVCRVMRVDGDNILLSIKRVAYDQANRKLHEYKKEIKAEKMLELAGKEMGKSLDDSYDEVGNELQEKFGSLSKAFEFMIKNPELLKSKGIPPEWVAALSEIAAKSHVEKEYEVKANLKLVSYEPDGIDIIRKTLAEAEKNGMEVMYISAPKYVLVGKGSKHKDVKAKVASAAESITKAVGQKNGFAEFQILEE